MVALLRGINVGSNRKVPMQQLREEATKLGFTDVETYIQSGNLVFDTTGMTVEEATARLESAIARRFGFSVDIVVRSAAQWKKYALGSPFPDAERNRPNLLLLGLSRARFSREQLSKLTERATQGERIRIVGDAIWVDFAKSVGKSKLTPALFNSAAGGPVTMRNWTTVLRLNEMLQAD